LVVFSEITVKSAHKATLTMILKYMNLTSTDLILSSPIVELPVGPTATSTLSLGIPPIPSTQVFDQQQSKKNSPPLPTIETNKEYKEYCKNIMAFESVLFTRSSVN
jgi:hypothetical protein